MQAHEIKSIGDKRKKRVGRGGKRGTTSGRGTKGQKARSGRRIRPQFRDILKKIPKKKGYRVHIFKQNSAVVNLKDLEKKFESGAEVSPKTLHEKGLVSMVSGKITRVKILGAGSINKNFVIKGCLFSEKAKEILEKSGSRILAEK